MLKPADDAFLARLKEHLPDAAFRQPEPRYYHEPRGRYQGQPGIILAPRNVDEVATIIRLAAEAHVGVVPYGGGTGLVGGQIMPEGLPATILSLERMNKIRATYPAENILIAEAGAILADVQTTAQSENRLFPLSLASEGSARIGGVLATNAGGTAVLKYGNARDFCLGLEAVLPNGEVWHGLKRLRKDNTGYDLKNLLIGAEGTLGVITAATLRLFPTPTNTGAALISTPSPTAALELLALAGERLGQNIPTFELMHRQGFDFLSETLPDISLPFHPPPEWTVFIEIDLPQGLRPDSALEELFATAAESGLATDGLIASSEAQRQHFWQLRESIPEANRRIGSVSSHDISLPLSCIPDFIEKAPAQIAKIGPFRINCFGHLGDGNLHWNVFPPKGQTRDAYTDKRDLIKRTVHDLVHHYGGSVSAEHGIGRLKVDDLERYGDPVKQAAMRSIKSALDPNGIMNPGALFRL